MTFRALTLFGLALGVIAGVSFPQGASQVALLGTIFLSLLKLIIIPLIFISCFLGFADVASTALLKKLGLRTVLYYAATSAFACIVGIVCVYVFLLGGINGASASGAGHAVTPFNFNAFILYFVPKNLFQSLSEGNIIHVVFIALAIGLTTHFIKQTERETLVNLGRSLDSIIMKIVHAIIFFSPLGVFSLVYSSVSKIEWNQVSTFGGFFLAVLVAALIHSVITLPVILKIFARYSPLRFVWQVKDALVMALSTGSSSATLPVSMTVVTENAKADKHVAGFVLPLGATLNMDGSALYQSIVIVFMAKMAGMDLTFTQILISFVIIMFSSAGTAGIPAGGVAMVALIMNILGIPAEYIGVYILVDRFLDYPITTINVWGDLIGAKVVSGAEAPS